MTSERKALIAILKMQIATFSYVRNQENLFGFILDKLGCSDDVRTACSKFYRQESAKIVEYVETKHRALLRELQGDADDGLSDLTAEDLMR